MAIHMAERRGLFLLKSKVLLTGGRTMAGCLNVHQYHQRNFSATSDEGNSQNNNNNKRCGGILDGSAKDNKQAFDKDFFPKESASIGCVKRTNDGILQRCLDALFNKLLWPRLKLSSGSDLISNKGVGNCSGVHAQAKTPESSDRELENYFPKISMEPKDRQKPTKAYVYVLVDKTLDDKILECLRNDPSISPEERVHQLMDTILYVGQTINPTARLYYHRQGDKWKTHQQYLVIKAKETLQMIIVACFEGPDCVYDSLLAEEILIDYFIPAYENRGPNVAGILGNSVVRNPIKAEILWMKRKLVVALSIFPNYLSMDALKCRTRVASRNSQVKNVNKQRSKKEICDSVKHRRLHNHKGKRHCATSHAKKMKPGECLRCHRKESTHWYIYSGKLNTRICHPCYCATRREKNLEQQRYCAICCMTVNSSNWYKHGEKMDQEICEPCYNRVLKPGECARCQRKESTRWYNYDEQPGARICNACYSETKREKNRQQPGHKCAICAKTVSCYWYNYGEEDQEICHTCYGREQRKKRTKDRLALQILEINSKITTKIAEDINQPPF